MKSLALFFSVLLLFTGCGNSTRIERTQTEYHTVNDLPGVTLSVQEGTVTDHNLIAAVTNEGEYDLTFGSFYCLELLEEDIWYQIPYLEQEHDIGWTSIGYEVQSGRSFEFEEINWQWLYGSLQPGHYRIVKDGIVGYGNDIEMYYFAAEFTIK